MSKVTARAVVKRSASVALMAALSSLAPWLRAQERDPAAAQALFDQARELSRQGNFAEACPKLQESNRLDPGIGTQFHLADCYEQIGRVASAWAQFLDVASQARASNQLDREKAAGKRAEKLAPRLPRLLVAVPELSRVEGLEIRRNGMLVGAAQWGAPVPVDPGEVELSVSAPGKRRLRQGLRLEAGKTATYSVPELIDDDSALAPAVPARAATVPAVVAEPRTEAPGPRVEGPPHAEQGRKNTGVVLALTGVGVVGLGVGGVFASIAKGKDSDSKQHGHCKPSDPRVCDATGVTLRNDAIKNGNVATVAALVGGAALVGAATVWLLSGGTDVPRAGAPTRIWATADIGPGHGGVAMQGRF